MIEGAGTHFNATFPIPLEAENALQRIPLSQEERLRGVGSSDGLGRVAIYGHCFAANEEVVTVLDHALKTKQIERLHTLPGSFSAVVVSPDGVGLSSDISGQFPLYYSRDSSQVRVSSSPTLGQATLKPDKLMLGHSIACPGVSEVVMERSFLQGVSRVPGGCSVEFTERGQYHRESRLPFPERSTSLTETAEVFGTALDRAVSLRAGSEKKITSDLSGGLDSTSIAFLALRHMAGELDTFTYYDPSIPTGDIAAVRRYLELNNRLKPHLLATNDAMLPYRQMGESPFTEEPNVYSMSWALNRERFGRIMSAGSELHLTGEGGDVLLDVSPAYIGDLLRRGLVKEYFAQATAFAKINYLDPKEVIQASFRLAGTSLQQSLKNAALSLETGSSERLSFQNTMAWAAVSGATGWLTKKMRLELAELIGSYADQVEIPRGIGVADYVARKTLLGAGVYHHSLREQALPFGFDVHAPFLDEDVVKASLTLSVFKRANPYEFKTLLRHALIDKVPQAVTHRPSTGYYSEHHYKGVRLARPYLKALFTNPYLADLGVIEPRPILQALDSMMLDAQFPFMLLPQLVANEKWLRSLEGPSSVPSVKCPERETVVLTEIQSVDRSPQYRLSQGVMVAALASGACALLNTGINAKVSDYEIMSVSAGKLFRNLVTGNDFDKAIRLVLAEAGELSPEQTNAFYMASRECLKQWQERGWLIEGVGSVRFPYPEQLSKVTPPEAVKGRTRELLKGRGMSYSMRLLTLGSLAIASRLKNLPVEKIFKWIDRSHKWWGKEEATPQEAYDTLEATHQISRFYLGKAACIEVSLAAAINLAVRRKRVKVVLGAAADPPRFHAWIKARGESILSSADEQAEGVFQPFQVVPHNHPDIH